MADLTIVPNSLSQGTSGVTTASYIAGETLAPGQPVYKAANGKVLKADNNVSTLVATVIGIALDDALVDETLRVHRAGDIDLGATLTVGEIYCLSDTAGKICPFSEVLTGQRVSILGVATTAANLHVEITNSGVVHA